MTDIGDLNKKEELENDLKFAFDEFWFNKDKDFVSIVQVELDEVIYMCNKLKEFHYKQLEE